jgi:hypothetical protein
MIETTTIARDLVTPEIAQLLIAEAQALLAEHPTADADWKARIQEIQNDPDASDDAKRRAQEIAQQEDPQEFENYSLVNYLTKTIDMLGRPLDPTMPKITIPHDIVTDEVMTKLSASLDEKEAKVKPLRGHTLHPHHVQSRERLNKMAPGLAQYRETKQAARKAHKDAKAAVKVELTPAEAAADNISVSVTPPPKPKGTK